jgi:hypothetical protein
MVQQQSVTDLPAGELKGQLVVIGSPLVKVFEIELFEGLNVSPGAFLQPLIRRSLMYQSEASMVT